ncbi:MAG TPA: LytTR family DNA-binding domain-containing protein [Puia sp.]|nr:LytTR family DNA-binding domain-containing protein [Puia sp.]
MNIQLNSEKSDCRRIIVRKGKEYFVFKQESIAYIYLENKLCFLVEKAKGLKYILSRPLRDIEMSLDSANFYRINKKYLVNIDSVEKFRVCGKGRMEIILAPDPGEKIIISQLNAQGFKKWIMMGENYKHSMARGAMRVEYLDSDSIAF